jgi:hypothetical protein
MKNTQKMENMMKIDLIMQMDDVSEEANNNIMSMLACLY